MKHKLVITFFLLLSIAFCNAQEKLSLSLKEAQDFAIENNKALKNARIDLQISEQKAKESIAKGLPQIDAGLDYTSYFGYEMEFNFGGGGGGASFTQEQIALAMQNSINAFPGVTQLDLYKYQAGSYFSSQLQAMLPPTTIKMTDQSTGKIQIGQLIYNGQYWVGMQTAKLGKKIAEQGLDNSILDVKENVINTYFMVLITRETLDLFRQNIENLKKIQGHTQKMYDAGIAELTDVDQIKIQVAMLENTQRTMQRALEMGHNLMRFQLGVDSNVEINLTESLEQLMAKVNGENSSAKTGSIDNNLMLQMLETSEKISEQMVQMEKMAYVPTLTGFYAYNQKFLTTGFDMTPNHIAGLSVSIPVFSSGARKARVNQAKLQMEQAKINSDMVNDQLRMQENQLKLDLKSAIEDYSAQKENVSVAKRAFENVNRKYEQGMVSSLDLTQSNSNYLQAETSFIQSTFSLIKAQLALDKLYNQL